MVVGLSHSSENVVSLESIDDFTRVNYFEPLVDYLHHLSCASLRQQATEGRARDVYHFSHILHTPSAGADSDVSSSIQSVPPSSIS